MTTTTLPQAPTLSLMAAADGGFVVFEEMGPHPGLAPKIQFGGSLPECLAYLQRHFSPPVMAKPGAISEDELAAIRKRGPEGVVYLEEEQKIDGFGGLPGLRGLGEPSLTLDVQSASSGILLNDLRLLADGTVTGVTLKRQHAEWLLGALGDRAELHLLEEVLEDLRLREAQAGMQIVAVDHVVCWLGDIQAALTQPKWVAWDLRPMPAIFHETRGADAIPQATRWLKTKGAQR